MSDPSPSPCRCKRRVAFALSHVHAFMEATLGHVVGNSATERSAPSSITSGPETYIRSTDALSGAIPSGRVGSGDGRPARPTTALGGPGQRR